MLGVTAAILVIAGGVTYAALQSQVKLTGNLIETANANLQVSTDATNFTTQEAGFEFANIVPGNQPQTGNTITFRNSGGTALALKFSVSSTPSNSNNVDLSKVNVILTPFGGQPQNFTLQALITANSTGGLAVTSPATIFAGARQQFTVQVSMAADALSTSSANLGNIDFAFTGVAVNN